VATSEAIDKIDFSELTSADEQLIAQFQNVSKTFLDQAQTVFGTDANYSKIKENVKSAFDSLAANLVTATSEADPTTFKDNLDLLKTSFAFLDEATKNLTTSSEGAKDSISGDGNLNSSLAGLKTNSDNATSALSGDGKLNSSIDGLGTASTTTKTKTGSFAETLASLETQLDDSSSATKTTRQETTDLSNTLVSTSTPLQSTSVNLQTIAQNTANVFETIADNALKLKTAIEQETQLTTEQPAIGDVNAFSQFVIASGQLRALAGTGSSLSDYAIGAQQVAKISADGQRAYIEKKGYKRRLYYNEFGATIGQKVITPSGAVESGSDTLGGKSYKSSQDIGFSRYDYYVSGQLQSIDLSTKPFAKGAWNINGTVQPAMLHRGEMVIRQDDAPAVRSYLSSTGASSKYGAPISEAPSYDTARTIELLSLILEQLRDQKDPTVYLNARKVSEELQRYRGLSA
jgi:hypothetical protein